MASPNKIPRACGPFVEGNLTVNGDMNTHVNAQASVPNDSAAERRPFRCNLPTPTLHYTGRAEILEKILNHFVGASNDRNDWLGRTVAIVGLGGIGKSEAAFKFAKKNRTTYPCAACIHAETEQSALDSFLSLAKSLKIVPKERQRADLELVKEVYRHFDAEYRHKVLLIFDNAIKLQSDESNFGIMDYLPTDDLPNERFPFIIITSQTADWQKGIKTFRLEELNEEESLEFFRSSFDVSSSECDHVFKVLHTHLQGYPLAMTLAASNIDFESENHSHNWLQEEIKLYVRKFEKEESSILTQKINENWPSRYNKTLSTVWQLTFQRLKADPNGANAQMLLQAISFFHVPVTKDDLRRVLIECPYCPGTPDWMKHDRLKESIRLLQRLHVVNCVFTEVDYSHELKALQSNAQKNSKDLVLNFEEEVKGANNFGCELRVHRLVQLVTRLDMDCSVVLEDILRFLAFWGRTHYIRQLNVAAVEEAIGRTTLSTRTLVFVGLLALQSNRAAQRIVQTIETPVIGPAATIWGVLQLDKRIETLNEEAIQVLREFIRLSPSLKSLIDKRYFAYMALNMFYKQRIFPYVRDDGTSAPGIFLQSFADTESIACELFSTGCSFTDVCSLPLLCQNVQRKNLANRTVLVGNRIIQDLTKAKKPESRIAQIREQLSTYHEFVDRGGSRWHLYCEEMRDIYDSDDSWKKFESEVESCGLDQLKLQQVFSSIFDKSWSATNNKNFRDDKKLSYFFRELDEVVYKFLKIPRSCEVLIPLIESFVEVLIKRENELLEFLPDPKGNVNNAAIWTCSTLMNFCTQKECLGSNELFNRLCLVRILAEIKKMSIEKIRDVVQSFSQWKYLQDRHETMYEEFLEMYSESPAEEIRTLVTLCKEIQHEMFLAAKQYGYSK